MPAEPQSLKNHARFHPPFHFVVVPILLVHLVCSMIRLYRDTSFDNLEALAVAVALVLMALLTRVNALKAQDRVIRLEEQLRYARVLPPELAARAAGLRESQIIALRFASDRELPGLVEQTLAGQFAKPKDIKKAIQNWRADNFRV